MKKAIVWISAVIITIAAALYQRTTGPTYPVKYEFTYNDSVVEMKLPRSNNGVYDYSIKLILPEEITGNVVYKRYPTNDDWTTIAMNRSGDTLKAPLPHQPAAGKLEYKLELFDNGQPVDLHQKETVIIRYRDSVPAWIMIPHILLMFLGMLWSSATGLLAALKMPSVKRNAVITFIILVIGGLFFGPFMQKYAFGAFWTGWPFGGDLTDNKTLATIIVWGVAILLNKKKERRWLIIVAAVFLMGIYMIPHSANGSELDYESGEVMTGMVYLAGLAGTRLKLTTRSRK